jgi:hypothetical protein
MVPPESSPPITAVAKRNRMITSRMMCPNLSGTRDCTVGYVQRVPELLVEITLARVESRGWASRVSPDGGFDIGSRHVRLQPFGPWSELTLRQLAQTRALHPVDEDPAYLYGTPNVLYAAGAPLRGYIAPRGFSSPLLLGDDYAGAVAAPNRVGRHNFVHD